MTNIAKEVFQWGPPKGPNGEKPIIWRNANGTYSHHKDPQREWGTEEDCRLDLRFTLEWERSERE